MPKFKVIGRKYQDYYTYVDAEDLSEAYDSANSLPTDKWSEMETDDVIEAYEVTQDQDTVDLNQLKLDVE